MGSTIALLVILSSGWQAFRYLTHIHLELQLRNPGNLLAKKLDETEKQFVEFWIRLAPRYPFTLNYIVYTMVLFLFFLDGAWPLVTTIVLMLLCMLTLHLLVFLRLRRPPRLTS